MTHGHCSLVMLVLGATTKNKKKVREILDFSAIVFLNVFKNLPKPISCKTVDHCNQSIIMNGKCNNKNSACTYLQTERERQREKEREKRKQIR